MKQSVGLVYNPVAGMGRSRPSVEQVVQALQRAGGDVEMFPTRGPGDGVEQAWLAAERHQTIVVYGGDGSLNEALNGVAGGAEPPRVLLLPGGTMNVLCRDLRIPLDPLRAAGLLANGVARRIHLGLAVAGDTRRYFSLMAGAGLDARVVHQMSERGRMKRMLGPFAFLLTGLQSMWTYGYPEIEVEIDGERHSARSLIVGKSRGYGGWMSIADRADPGKPVLEVALSKRPGAFWHNVNITLALFERARWSPDYRFFTATRLRASGKDPGIPVQIDGDAAGALPMEFSIDGTTLEVLVPLNSA